MHGTGNVRFGDLFADTVAAHGASWAAGYYAKRGMALWECLFWLRAAAGK